MGRPRGLFVIAVFLVLLATCGEDSPPPSTSDGPPRDTSATGGAGGADGPGGGVEAAGGAPSGSDAPSGPAGPCETCAATCAGDQACEAPARCVKFGNGCTACTFCKAAEVCSNDVDDNCNGMIDEGCTPCPGKNSCGANQVCMPPA
jgi:hypothetical protein